MKKNRMAVWQVFSLMLACFFLCGFGKPKEESWDKEYRLSSLSYENESLNLAEYYSNGALFLKNDGTGRLILDNQACNVIWRDTNGERTVQIRDLIAHGPAEEHQLCLTIDELGITYVFTADGNSPSIPEEIISPASVPENDLQLRWNGEWDGRLWFSNTNGEWAEYENRTMAARAVVSLAADGSGILEIYNAFYSPDYPLARFSVHCSSDSASCSGEFVMSYPVGENGARLLLSQEYPSQIENTVIMHPDIWEYGHYYPSHAEDDSAIQEIPVDVLRISGTCSDSDGGFGYQFVLVR